MPQGIVESPQEGVISNEYDPFKIFVGAEIDKKIRHYDYAHRYLLECF
jgi:hypothetical protein